MAPHDSLQVAKDNPAEAGDESIDSNGQKQSGLSIISTKVGPRRRNLGRSSRRRRQKLMEIQRAEEQLLNNSNNNGKNQQDDDPLSDEKKNQNILIPSDRSILWPGVEEHRKAAAHGRISWEQDASMLIKQLGYVPGNAIKVAARVSDVPLLQGYSCHPDEPVVLQLYPLALRDENHGGRVKNNRKSKHRTRKKKVVPPKEEQRGQSLQAEDGNDESKTEVAEHENRDQTTVHAVDAAPTISPVPPSQEEDSFVVEPFPTLYWLTHPLLRILVSKMELQGMGIQFEQQLTKEAEAMALIHQANLAYGQERYDLLTSNDMDYIQQRNWERAFDPNHRGVAGIRNFASVKCLHAHAAHYLSHGAGSQDNVLGKWVMEEIAKTISSDNKN